MVVGKKNSVCIGAPIPLPVAVVEAATSIFGWCVVGRERREIHVDSFARSTLQRSRPSELGRERCNYLERARIPNRLYAVYGRGSLR